MNKDLLKKYIKDYTFELLRLGEINTTSNIGGYLTKAAFRKPKKQDINNPTGFESEPKPNMSTKTLGFKIVKPNDRLNSKDLWNPKKDQPKFDNLNEARYSEFKKQTKTRTPQEQLHMGVKEIQRKLDEINKLVEFTSRMKNELKGDTNELAYLKRTQNSLSKINEKIQLMNNKIKDLTE
jgi:hypothetical protein